MKRRHLGAEVSVNHICNLHFKYFYLPHSIGSKDFLCIRNKSQSSTACLLLWEGDEFVFTGAKSQVNVFVCLVFQSKLRK